MWRSFQTAVKLRVSDKPTVLSWEPVASTHHHADVARVHLLVFSFEAQPISEPRVGETHLDVGPIAQSQGEEGPPPWAGAPFAAFPSEIF